MGFWNSYNKEMARQGLSPHHANDIDEESAFDTCQSEVPPRSRSVPHESSSPESEPDDDPDMIAAREAFEQGNFEAAANHYCDALVNGNLHAALPLADIYAIAALYDKNDQSYVLGSDPERDFILDFVITLYLFCSLLPEVESEAEAHLNAIQNRCTDEYQFQRMVQRIGNRIKQVIAEDPVGFVKAMMKQRPTKGDSYGRNYGA